MGRLIRNLLFGALALTSLVACSATDGRVVEAPNYSELRSRGLRIALVPFEVSAGVEDVVSEALAPVGNLLALDGLGDDAPAVMVAGSVMQRALAALLADSPLEIEEIWLTRTELTHAGWTREAAADRDRAREVAELLQVDAVLYGEVYEWDRSYYGLQSTQSVGLRVWLVDGETGEELMEVERWRQEGTGITGGPTGQLSVVTAPIQGLQSSTLSTLALYVAHDVASDLLGHEPGIPLLAQNARGEVPRISFAGIEQAEERFDAGAHLTVFAVATAGSRLRFDIGSYRRGIPMVEVVHADEPRGSRATYLGTYVVQEGERFGPSRIRVHIDRVLEDGRRLAGPGRDITTGKVSSSAGE